MNIKEVIELVEKRIADPKSVSKEELRIADAALDAASAAAWSTYGDAAWCFASAVAAALDGDIDHARVWVAEYHKSLSD